MESFRSSKVLPGGFRNLGTIHLHIDGGANLDLIGAIDRKLKDLDRAGISGKSNLIAKAIAGPQRKDSGFRETYASHTPGLQPWEETFEYFSTIYLQNSESISERNLKIIREILEEFSKYPGVVVEIERVFGHIDNEGRWKNASTLHVPTIKEHSVGFRRSFTHPIEIHHAIDLPKIDPTHSAPLDLNTLRKIFTDLNVKIGGLFLFEKDNSWSYRSSQFAQYDNYQEIAQEGHYKIRKHFESEGLSTFYWTIVEQVLGIWKSDEYGFSSQIAIAPQNQNSNNLPGSNSYSKPTNSEEQYPLLKVPQLATWETICRKNSEFWVVTGNFLGDIDPDVREAMIINLKKGVRYTYFLRTYADLGRLRLFISDLSAHVEKNVVEQITPVLMYRNDDVTREQSQIIHGNDYFIKSPSIPNERSGYIIRRNKLGDSLPIGEPMTQDNIQLVVDELSPIFALKSLGIIIPPQSKEKKWFSVLFTDLVDSVLAAEQIDHEDWIQVLDDYDVIVAREVSKHRGNVLKFTGDGYICYFDDPRDCYKCASSLQRAVVVHNNTTGLNPIPSQKIAIDYGVATKVDRANSYDYNGPSLNRCSRILKGTNGDQILMSKTFVDHLNQVLGKAAFEGTTCLVGEFKLKGFEEPVIIYELLWLNDKGERRKGGNFNLNG